MIIHNFEPATYNFHEIIEGFIGQGNLSELTADLRQEDDPDQTNSIYKNMEQTSAHQKLYNKLDSSEGEEFYTLFEDFIRDVVRPMYDEPIYYQKKPTHRIHFKNSSGASRFHKDSDYGHNRAEINYSVPQTPMFSTNSIWIESEEDKGDYKSMEAGVGQFVEFKGAYLRHGAKQNQTGKTRVSFDFRVIKSSDWPEDLTDKSNWNEEDHENQLFQNAHNFTICK